MLTNGWFTQKNKHAVSKTCLLRQHERGRRAQATTLQYL